MKAKLSLVQPVGISKHRKSPSLRRGAILSAVLALTAHSAMGSDGTWSGAGGDTSWANPGNWDAIPGSTNGAAGTSADLATFIDGAIAFLAESDTNRNIGGIKFDASNNAFVVNNSAGGNTLYLSNAGIIQIGAAAAPAAAITHDLYAPLVFNGTAYTFAANSTSALAGLRVRGNISGGNSGATTLTLDGISGTTGSVPAQIYGTISDGLSSKLGIVKQGTGAWQLSSPGSAPNTYSGDTIINGGIIRLASSLATSDGAGALSANSAYTINSGGQLRVGVIGATAKSIQLNSGGTFDVPNTASQATNIVNLKSESGPAFFMNFADTALPGNQTNVPISLVGTTPLEGGIKVLPGAGTVDLGGATSPVDLGTVKRVLDVGGGAATYQLRFNGPITGGSATGGIVKKGAGIVRINLASSFNGNLEIQEGNINIRGSNFLTGQVSLTLKPGGTISVATSATNIVPLNVPSGPALFIDYSSLTNAAAVTAGTVILNLTGTVPNEGGVKLALGASAGSIDWGGTSSGTIDLGTVSRTFDIAHGGAAGASYDLRIRGPITGGSATGGIVKTGSGLLRLDNGAIGFTGGLELQAGTLLINTDNALTGVPNLLISGGDLRVNGTAGSGAIQTFGMVTMTKGTTTAGSSTTSTVKGTSFALNVASPDTVSSSVIFADSTVSAPLTKTGNGKATITGNCVYTGGTTISGGTLELGSGGSNGIITGNVTNNANLTFNRSSGTVSFAGVISGSGSVAQNGSGRTTLTGLNGYSGPSIVNAGTLVLSKDAQAPVLTNAGGAIINGGRLVLDYSGGGTDPAASVKNNLQSSFPNFTSGRFRTTNAVNPSRGIGWRDDTANSQVIVRNTYLGDANLDGTVNEMDFTLLSTAFGTAGGGAVWYDGDSNYDGKVNALDFNALAANFGQTATPGDVPGASLGTLVPEPTVLLPAAVLCMIGRKRRGVITQSRRHQAR